MKRPEIIPTSGLITFYALNHQIRSKWTTGKLTLNHQGNNLLLTIMVAIIEFDCIETNCNSSIQFNLLQLKDQNGKIKCKNCHKLYQFDKEFLAKLDKLRTLILAVRDAEDILGDCNISVVSPAGEVKLPYRLLLTRLNTLISLNCEGKKLEFNLRLEPLTDTAF